MIPDAQLQFCDAQAFTVDAASSNIIDLGVTGRQIGNGEPLCIALAADVAADHTTGDETYAFVLKCDDDVAFGSPTTVATFTILFSALTLGAQNVLVLPVGFAFERYLRLDFDGSGTTPTVTLTAFLMPLQQVGNLSPVTQHYPDAINIQ